MKIFRYHLQSHGIAVLAVAIALFITLLIQPLLKASIFAFFYPAVTLVTLYGGLEAGLVAIFLSALTYVYFLQKPLYSLYIPDLDSWVRLLVFFVVALSLCLISSALRTSQRQTQVNLKKLQESEEKFRQLAENVEEVFFIYSLDLSKLLYINPAYEKIWGRSCQSLYEQPSSWLNAVHEDDRDRIIAAFQKIPQGETFREEYRIVRPNGDIRWIFAYTTVIANEFGKSYRMAGIAEDITDRKQAEMEIRLFNETLEQRVRERTDQLQEANEELEAFTYTVSHDLRAPLRTMQGFAQALQEDYGDRLDSLAQDYIHYIIDGSLQMDELISDLLDYSRLTRTQIQLQIVDFNEVVAAVLQQLNGQIQERQAEIIVNAPLLEVMAHKSILMQAIANIIGNAIKFVSADEKPKVQIYTEERVWEGQDWVKLWIVDNGIGIAPEHQERIFRVFERLHGVETYPGTGIGLAIVRKGLERMGGRVGVESQLNRGSRFWIALSKPALKGNNKTDDSRNSHFNHR